MRNDPTNLLNSVARYAAARAAAQTPPVELTLGGNLWVNKAQATADPYAVLRAFGGSAEPTNPKASVNVQLLARGTDNVAVLQLCQAVYEAVVLDDAGLEARMVQVPAYEADAEQPSGTWTIVNATTIGRPGQVGRDTFDVVDVVANFTLGFFRLN